MTKNLFYLLISILVLSCKAEILAPFELNFSFDETPPKKGTFYSIYQFDGQLDSTVYKNGSSSLKLNPKKKYPFQVICKSLNPKGIYQLSYWSKGEGILFFNGEGNGEKIRLSAKRVTKKENGWKKHELIIHFPMMNKKRVDGKIVIYKNKGVDFWMDDLKITAINTSTDQEIHHVKIDTENYEKLAEYRDNVFDKPVIDSKSKKWISGTFDGYDTKFKLKGDWTDHIIEGVWSLKLKSKSVLYKDMPSFNIQTPNVRNFHKEWIFFELCRSNGLVTPNFDFELVSYNNSEPIIVAFEENFSNNFVERKIGYNTPALRFYEDHIFPYFQYTWSNKGKALEIEPSYIYTFDKKYAKPEFKAVYKNSANTLKDFINGDVSKADYKSWATFYAIISLTKGYHGLAWHNQRFFINKKGKVQPIPYDANTPYGETENWGGGKPFVGEYSNRKNNSTPTMYKLITSLMKEPDFRKLYVEELEKISNQKYLNNFINDRKEYLNTFFNIATKYYDFDTTTNYILENGKAIEEAIPNFKQANDSVFVGYYEEAKGFLKSSTIKLKDKRLQSFVAAFYEGENIKVVNATAETVFINCEGWDNLKVKANTQVVFKSKADELEIVPKENKDKPFTIKPTLWISTMK